MSNRNDNKLDTLFKTVLIGAGAFGAIYGVAKYMLGQEENSQQYGHSSRHTPSRENQPQVRQVNQQECMVCSDLHNELITLLPCTHSIACEDCCARMKKCLICHRPIQNRVTSDSKTIPYKPPNMTDDIICDICNENKKRILLDCGHIFCESCSEKVSCCPICRKTISSRSKVYI